MMFECCHSENKNTVPCSMFIMSPIMPPTEWEKARARHTISHVTYHKTMAQQILCFTLHLYKTSPYHLIKHWMTIVVTMHMQCSMLERERERIFVSCLQTQHAASHRERKGKKRYILYKRKMTRFSLLSLFIYAEWESPWDIGERTCFHQQRKSSVYILYMFWKWDEYICFIWKGNII